MHTADLSIDDHPNPQLQDFAWRLDRALGRDLVGVLHVPNTDEMVVLSSQTGASAVAETVQRIPPPEGVGGRINVQGFEDFCSLLGLGDPRSLNAVSHGAVLADPMSSLDELCRRCRSALQDPAAVNLEALHSYLSTKSREHRRAAASGLAEVVSHLQSALLAAAQAQHAATDPEGEGETASLGRLLQFPTIDSLKGEIDELVGIADRQALASLVANVTSITGCLDEVLAALERYETQVFGCCDGPQHG